MRNPIEFSPLKKSCVLGQNLSQTWSRVVAPAILILATLTASTSHAGFFDIFRRKKPQPPVQYLPAPPSDGYQVEGSYDSLPPGIDLSYNSMYLWPITKSEWTWDDEVAYSRWIQALGRSQCGSLTDCLENPANTLRTPGEVIKLYTDCADLPYQLRGYFSWKNGLPFSYMSSMRYRLFEGKKPEKSESQMSTNGNYPTRRYDIKMPRSNDTFYANRVLHFLSDSISSGHMRLDPTANALKTANSGGEVIDDFYPVPLQAGSIRPGTIMYNPAGHVGVVYDVYKDGRIRMLSAHPAERSKESKRIIGNPYGSLSRSWFGPSELDLSKLTHGHGFKNFRPVRLDGASIGHWRNPYTGQVSAVYLGGSVRPSSNAEIRDFSLEQFYGTVVGSTSREFVFQGTHMDYFEYLRTSLKGNLKINPTVELAQTLETVCQLAKNRAKVVNSSTELETHLQVHPAHLPNNIFTAISHMDSPELAAAWEKGSTSSRDVRFKRAILEIRNRANQMIQMQRSSDPLAQGRIEYLGQNLKADLAVVYQKVTSQCQIEYNNSNLQPVRLNLKELISRAVLISDDPYLCPELRWGARDMSELKYCAEAMDPQSDKMRWYRATQRFRNKLETNNGWEMNYSLADLEAATANGDDSLVWGTPAAPIVSLHGLLD